MKRHLLFLSLAIQLHFLGSCTTEQDKKATDESLSPDLIKNPTSASGNGEKQLPVMTFDAMEHDFGTVVAGEKVAFSFHFRNTGNEDLLIRHCQASCGCTVPEWPKEPVPPGGDGFIAVTFDSNGKSGKIHKTVSIISNTIPNTATLTITGQVNNQ